MSATGFAARHHTAIPSLKVELHEFEHEPTGARHFHLASDDTNNAFLVAFLTVPQDSTGIPHILEHTSLCGSKRFPVRDPFFMMIRRSLNTFMNAFTASDWTAYPFASQNRKDFDNLLEVYLDAVFFPLLDPLDFAQEGHRMEFSAPNDPTSDLVFKGVVYNEMKGALSSPIAQVAQTLQSTLFPTITYHHNSGGDPAHIPDLTHADLKAFHARHYHPSNAVFMTYGSFPHQAHQEKIEALALSQFERADIDLSIPDERRYPSPQVVQGGFAIEGELTDERQTHVLMGWLLGHSNDVMSNMRTRLLAGVLLDNSASPLRHALETTELGAAPSELCGLDDSTREATFVCGLEGCDEKDADAIEALILSELQKVADEGVPQAILDSVMHQVELAQREVTGGGFPYGLQLMVRGLNPALDGKDPAAALDIDPILTALREETASPDFIPNLVRSLLLDNPHRVRLDMSPDPSLASKRLAEEQSRLAEVQNNLDPDARAELLALADALKARQESDDDPERLPKVGIEDVPSELTIAKPVPEPLTAANVGRGQPGPKITTYGPGTNGLTYTQLIVQLPELPREKLAELPLLCDVLAEVGVGNRDYLEVQALQAAVTGGIRARTSVRTSPHDAHRINGYFVLAAKSLANNQDAMIELLHDTFATARFDEYARLRELVSQARLHADSQVTDHGHALALAAASAGLTPCSALDHAWGGLEGLQRLQALDDSLSSDDPVAAWAESLAELLAQVREGPTQFLAIAEPDNLPGVRERISTAFAGSGAQTSSVMSGALHGYCDDFAPASINQAWTVNTQVNFCARVFPAVPQAHPDAAALRVLGPLLRNGYLHRAIREQGGAYGAGSAYSPDATAFRFFSYRDPRLSETLEDFDRAASWVLETGRSERLLEEAILGVISDIDRPESPSGAAVDAFFGDLHERDAERRRAARDAVLNVGWEDLRHVAETYLANGTGNSVVLTSAAALSDAERTALGDPDVHEV